jgi:D-alanyl-D-alanine carboxypeptidase
VFVGAWKRWAAALLAVALVGVAACSDDDSGSSSGSDPTAATNESSGQLEFDGDAINETVDSVLEKTTTPGAVVLLRQGDEEFLAAYGTREYGGGEPVTVDDHFRIGSNTKTMTGTVVLQLVDEGLIALDDPISVYFPNLPNGESITIANLLEMRSSLASYSSLIPFNRTLDEEPERVWEPEELVDLGLAEPPVGEPGQQFDYSNTNTVLLGMLIEQITGNPVEDEFRTRIFEPLGLEDTVMPAKDDASIPEPHPHGYLWGTNESTADDPALPEDVQEAALAGDIEPNDVTDDNPSWGWTAGAGISTARDLATYVEALVNGGLLSDELQQERLDSIQPADPDNPSGAGYGLGIAQLGPLLGHDGSLPGFQSVMGHDPESGLTMIVLTNLQAGPDGAQTANEIALALIPVLFGGG